MSAYTEAAAQYKRLTWCMSENSDLWEAPESDWQTVAEILRSAADSIEDLLILRSSGAVFPEASE